jgi:hypothetical protein
VNDQAIDGHYAVDRVASRRQWPSIRRLAFPSTNLRGNNTLSTVMIASPQWLK